MRDFQEYARGIPLPVPRKRVTLFCGHYGSGKSTVALGWTELLRRKYPGDRTALADLDIVNPYFRTRDSEELIRSMGAELITSEYASTNVDLPAMPQSAYRITADRELRVVIDVGGDDRGALALGRYSPALLCEGDFDMLAVVNSFRPLTSTAADAAEVLREISGACGLPVTGIVNCANLGSETTADDVLRGLEVARETADIFGVPVVFTAARPEVCRELLGRVPAGHPLLPLEYTISHGGVANGG